MRTAWLGATLLPAWFLLLVWGLRIAGPVFAGRAEVSRKILHVGMGAGCLPLPWLFPSPWPVAALAAGFVLAFAAARAGLPPRRLLGGLLQCAGRSSVGELCFPIAVALVFFASHGDPRTFWPPLLLLSIADAAAALAGTARGVHHIRVGGASKSLEGSLAFLAAAVPCTLLPLVVASPVPFPHALVLALALAPFVTILEAGAPNGWDNLLVPLGGFLLLDQFLALAPSALLARLAGGAGLLGVVALALRWQGSAAPWRARRASLLPPTGTSLTSEEHGHEAP